MKRVAALLCVVLLCGCTAKGGVSPRLIGIKGEAQIKFFNEEFECAFSSAEDGEITVEILSPEHLKEMSFVYKNKTLTAKYKELEYSPNLDAMPSLAVIRGIIEVLSESTDKNAQRNAKDENYFLEGKIEDICYTLYISPAGLPLSAQIPDKNYTITFKNITLIK